MARGACAELCCERVRTLWSAGKFDVWKSFSFFSLEKSVDLTKMLVLKVSASECFIYLNDIQSDSIILDLRKKES